MKTSHQKSSKGKTTWRMVRRKIRLHRAARKSRGANTKKHRKEGKKQFHKVETQYVNNIETECLEKNVRKPFWRYAKSKKKNQDNIGIAPLRHKGSMTNDSKEKAKHTK